MQAKKKAIETATIPVADNSKHYSFFEDVWDVVRQIPAGRVTTYGLLEDTWCKVSLEWSVGP
jgi:methylated-DNA-protein-cysteine methyltransferase-like protein